MRIFEGIIMTKLNYCLLQDNRKYCTDLIVMDIKTKINKSLTVD